MNRRNTNRTGPLGGSGLIAQWGASSMIRSVQYGTMTVTTSGTNTATITAVDTANSVVQFTGIICDTSTSNPVFTHGRVSLTNSTTVTGVSYPDASTRTIGFVVFEYAPGVLRSRQAVAITISPSAGSNTATITSVNTAKSVLVYGGVYINAGDDKLGANFTLTNATTVTATNGNTVSGSTEVYGTVVEFF